MYENRHLNYEYRSLVTITKQLLQNSRFAKLEEFRWQTHFLTKFISLDLISESDSFVCGSFIRVTVLFIVRNCTSSRFGKGILRDGQIHKVVTGSRFFLSPEKAIRKPMVNKAWYDGFLPDRPNVSYLSLVCECYCLAQPSRFSRS